MGLISWEFGENIHSLSFLIGTTIQDRDKRERSSGNIPK